MFHYVDISAIDRIGKRIVEPQEIEGPAAPSRARKVIRAGDVLVSTVRPNLNAVAVVPDHLDGEIASTGFAVLRPKRQVLSERYLYYYCCTPEFVAALSSKVRGAQYPAVSDGDVRNISVPLPALSEQRRIVEILDQADRLRRLRTTAATNAKQILPALFTQTFGDPATNPMGWRVVALGSLAEVRGGKRLPKGEDYSPSPTPFRYIRGIDIRPNHIVEDKLVYLCPEVQSQIARYVVANGDVVMTIAGKIGVCAPVPEHLSGVNLTENAARLVPRTAESFDSTFLATCLNSSPSQGAIRGHTGQVTIAKLALFRIAQLPVPCPPLSLQRAFARRCTALWAAHALQERSRAAIELTWQRFLAGALRGELTALWREAHMKELLQEMEKQANALSNARAVGT